MSRIMQSLLLMKLKIFLSQSKGVCDIKSLKAREEEYLLSIHGQNPSGRKKRKADSEKQVRSRALKNNFSSSKLIFRAELLKENKKPKFANGNINNNVVLLTQEGR